MATTNVSEKKLIRYQCCVPENPVCLRWTSPLGVWLTWVFSWNQDNSIQTGSTILFEHYIENLETADTQTDKQSQVNIPKMKLGADNLDDNDFGFVQSIVSAIKVQILMNPNTWVTDGGPVWRTVILETGQIPLGNTRSKKKDIEFIIEFPRINIQEQ